MKRIAEDLVKCGYIYNANHGSMLEVSGVGHGFFHSNGRWEIIDPFANTLSGRRQLDALLWFHISYDKELTLTGDGHFDAREQTINFIKSKYERLSCGVRSAAEHPARTNC